MDDFAAPEFRARQEFLRNGKAIPRIFQSSNRGGGGCRKKVTSTLISNILTVQKKNCILGTIFLSVQNFILKNQQFSMKCEYTLDEQLGPILYIQIRNRKYGLCFCHRRKDRTIKFFGLENYFCSRCMGLLFGGILGILLMWIHIEIPLILLILLMIPMLVDGFLQLFSLRESNNIIRLTTGFCFGLALPLLIDFLIFYVL
jgi:uncharacterized membrane protein